MSLITMSRASWLLKLSLPHRHALSQITKTCPQAIASMCTDDNSILGRSSVLHQDGLDIQELPLVIRRLDALELPFYTPMYSSASIRKITVEDESFKHQLMDCRNIPQVFQLLEVPGDKVTAHSASFALQRLCALQQGSSDQIQSFLRKAILNELCETVTQDMYKLTNDTVVSLVKCCLVSSKYEARYIEKINTEVEKRIGDGGFTIQQLCTLVDTLYGYQGGSQVLGENVWIHLSSRYKEFDEMCLPLVYKSMKYLPLHHRHVLWRLVDKRMAEVCWKLTPDDIMLIVQRMVQQNRRSYEPITNICKWLHMNIHAIQDPLMKHIVTSFNQLNYYVMSVHVPLFERYITARISTMDRSVTAVIMKHFLMKRFISPRIFDTVARDFAINSDHYKTQEILNVLRPFGQLNYQPPNATELFQTIENVLNKRFSEFHPADMAELLASFVYVERLPINFLQRLFTIHFRNQVKLIVPDSVRYRAMQHLLEVQAAIMMDYKISWLAKWKCQVLGLPPQLLGRSNRRLHELLHNQLKEIIGLKYFRFDEHFKYMPHHIDFVIRVNNRKICNWSEPESSEEIQLALVILHPLDYCFIKGRRDESEQRLMGYIEMKFRHLRSRGYNVMQIPTHVYQKLTKNTRSQYLRSLLEPYIDLNQHLELLMESNELDTDESTDVDNLTKQWMAETNQDDTQSLTKPDRHSNQLHKESSWYGVDMSTTPEVINDTRSVDRETSNELDGTNDIIDIVDSTDDDNDDEFSEHSVHQSKDPSELDDAHKDSTIDGINNKPTDDWS